MRDRTGRPLCAPHAAPPCGGEGRGRERKGREKKRKGREGEDLPGAPCPCWASVRRCHGGARREGGVLRPGQHAGGHGGGRAPRHRGGITPAPSPKVGQDGAPRVPLSPSLPSRLGSGRVPRVCCRLQVVKALRCRHRCGEGQARAICEKVQAKLLKECHDPARTCITELRISHWEEAIRETIGGEANRSLAAECYFLWKSTRLRHLTLAEETRGMLTELRKAVRLLLLTNGDRQTQREKIEACACQPYFDAIVVGGEQKEEKPAPSIFHYCCDLLGVQPAECVMVGDSLDTDIQGGLNAGLKATVWLNKTMATPADSSPVPHYVISSVLDLPAVLQKMERNVNAKLGNEHAVSSNGAC